MRLVRVGEPGAERPGVLDAAGLVRDVSGFAHDIDGDLLADPERLAAIAAGRQALPELPATRFGPPIARPGTVVGIGLNYRCHAAEAGAEPPAEPIVFLKPSGGIIGPNDEIVLPPGSAHTDWEVELGVVIGTRLRSCPDPRTALRSVAGYVAANDVTERAQLASGPTWVRGKCHDTFTPLGPWLLTADEIGDPQDLRLEAQVNGIPRQRGSTADMVFGVGELLAHLSGLMTLHPGDLVLTGTPAGVAALQPEPRPFLRPRDVVDIEVQHLGRQRSTIRG
ncbi:fumarylacetoacetate hydrolase family protein [Saccharopolyspora flava]|uniref:2-keto-4-pentenoate hydratase/2-oxohepta-3-ene-1,7-dioic acid hydratase (Catechol pathway) n=1 Tax=Saccharopolyspora flava TaxID=95161 RepID=A0A1I6S9S1_9PSEU|nr:fumarylacetoacetate hydrolase family protein [Saccharopolyspora flava]SFS73696.1 2-keto-4-pentenoate hydratase/2-oxohepta-3-ene-1,7-dioic acid hydratase (catechol pathway) [Saccharopolyspora flava]